MIFVGNLIVQATAGAVTPSGDFPPNSAIENATLTSGAILRTLSAPLAPGDDAILTWSNFSCSSLPSRSSIIAIYPVATLTRKAVVGTLGLLGICYCVVGGQTLYTAGSGGGEFGPTKFVGGTSIGTALTDLIGRTAYIRNNSTINAGGGYGDLFSVESIGFEVHYSVPLIPIGHAANCNAYDPIVLDDGATTPPGHGLLIG